MFNEREEMLKKYFIQEGNEIVQYQKLSEDQKEMFSREIVAKIVKSIEDKAYSLDNKMVESSKGDITKLPNYSYINDSLELLNNIQASSEEKIPFLDTLNDARKNLIDFTPDFVKGFKTNKEIIKVFYSQTVLALIYSISFTIASTMDYVKDPVGTYQSNIRYNIEKMNKYPTVNIECLDKFNLMAKNGELKQFLVRTLTDKKLNEDAIAFMAGSFAVLLGIAKFIPSIPEVLRMFVSMSYFTRVQLSDYLKLQAYYIEINVERQRNLTNPNMRVIKNQEKVMKKLVRLADKIDIDQKIASKNTKNEIEKENKKISKSIKDSQVSASGNDFPNEIIL